jgi:hypothetical protein
LLHFCLYHRMKTGVHLRNNLYTILLYIIGFNMYIFNTFNAFGYYIGKEEILIIILINTIIVAFIQILNNINFGEQSKI